MSEQQFREIQLSGKQLVFLFMTTVVVAVAVFLLGVSVGRGVGPAGDQVADLTDQMATVAPPGELPPPTEITPADTTYHDDLLGSQTPPAEPEPIAEPVSEDAADPGADAPALEPAPAPAPAPPAQRGAAAAEASAAQQPPASSGWFLQVGAYRSRENADRQVEQLVSKGYRAITVAPESAGGLHRVRVGPFAERTEATRIQARLRSEEGLSPSLTR